MSCFIQVQAVDYPCINGIGGERSKRGSIEPCDATITEAEPEVSFTIGQAGGGIALYYRIRDKSAFEYLAVKTAKPLPGSNPQKSVPVLVQGINKRIDQSLLTIVVPEFIGLGSG
jgi:hypothetical protein